MLSRGLLGTVLLATTLPASAEQLRSGYLFDLLDYERQMAVSQPLGHSLQQHFGQMGELQWGEAHYSDGGGLLWRNPERGLLSTRSSYLSYDTEQLYRFGAEGEWYKGSLTALGRAGYIDSTLESQPFAGVDLRWYATDNFSVQIGGEQIDDISLGSLRMEYQPRLESVNGLSFFARAAGGHHDSQYVLGGLRYSFGDTPSLIQRDRSNPNAAEVDRLSPHFRSIYLRRGLD
ncbi:MAG: hypothetical protein WD572_02650 [Gammaproteobacteria bacterium]